METKKIKQKPRITKAEKVKTRQIAVDSYSATGDKKGTTTLPENLFGQKPNKVLLAQAVRVYLSNQRSAGAKTKTRGEIQSSTKKIYRQKGTGGARHGARSAPIFVGGGIAHGPRGIENYALELPRTLRKKALVSALSARFAEGSVVVAEFDHVEPKTSPLAKAFRKMELKGSLTLVHAGNNDLWQAARNIENVNLVSAKLASAYNILLGKNLVVTPEAVSLLEEKMKPKLDMKGKTNE